MAAHFGVRVNSVQRWIQRAKVPATRVYALCALVDFAILPGSLNAHFRLETPAHKRVDPPRVPGENGCLR